MNKKFLYLLFFAVLVITGCSDSGTNKETIPQTSYERDDYERLYNQLEEGMTLDKVRKLFDSEGDISHDVLQENGKKLQTIDWFSHDRESNIGCDFVDDVCNYKNGWEVIDGEVVWKKE